MPRRIENTKTTSNKIGKTVTGNWSTNQEQQTGTIIKDDLKEKYLIRSQGQEILVNANEVIIMAWASL